ncbi:MAG: acyl-ACP--UDP-N-acetylglucosamine O-acyltransferase [Alphaproteobacteria bacterium]|nr:acyl-ACP--UDP-N-acetylglucosamine O-acyltransferase [Alphaproteobacteria bacterium]
MIHPTAIIEPGARLAAGVSVGAYALIGPQVEIGEGTTIGPHVVVEGRTRIGRGNRIWQFTSIGAAPQDKKYGGEDTAVEIGDGNTIREFVTINRGTAGDAGVTRVGDDNWIMAYVHFAHDCQIGSHTIFANYSGVAGHVRVGDWAILGAATIAHQFVRIGAHSFTGMATLLDRDLPPYVGAAGNRAQPYGINTVGLRRRGFPPAVIDALKRAYKTIYRGGLALEDVLHELEAQSAGSAEVRGVLEFLKSSKRGFVR